MKKTTLRQVALKLAFVAFVLLAPLGLRAQQTAPYNEGFESMSSVGDLNSAGWEMVYQSHSGSFLTVETSANNVFAGSKALDIDSWNAGSTSDYVIVGLPLITNKEVNELQITFSYKVSTGNVDIGYLTDADDGSTFVSLASFNSSSTYSTQTVELSTAPSNAARIAIKYSNWYRCYVDAVTVEELPTCFQPQNLTASLTPGDGSIATLTWQRHANGTENDWVVEYGTDPNFNGATSVNVTGGTPSKALTGLTPEQTYYARVKADCGGGDESDWCSTPISFTPSDAYTITVYDGTGTHVRIPMYGNYFDAFTKCEFIIPATDLTGMQWGSINSITFYAKTVATNNDTWANTNQKVFVKEVPNTTLGGSYSGMEGATVVFDGLLPMPTTSTNGYTITFSQPYTYSGGNLLIGVYNDVTGNYNDVTWYGTTGLASGVSSYGYNYSSLSGVNYNADSFLPKTTLNFTPGVAPSCLPPTDLAATPSTTSAELSWTANSSETAWTIYYKKTTDENYTEVANATNPYTLEGLTAATNYQYYVVANCAADDASDPSTVFPFATECAVIPALGYSENFDTYTAGDNVLPICWSYINTTTYSYYQGYPKVYNSSANSASNCLYLYSYAYYYSGSTSYDPQPQYAILPEMDNLDGKQITLFAKGYYASSTLKVGRMTDPTDASTFSLCQELTLTTSYQEFEVELTGTGNYIALMIDAATSSRTTNGVYVDDITVENVPTCRKPSALMLDNPSARTAHTATLKWTDGEEGQTAWQIAYSTDANFDPNSVTPIDVTTNPATIDGLAQSTPYYAYVRANCGNGDYSAWNTNKATFTTIAGNNAPTGLAVPDISVSSSSAIATWNANAANELHQLYELYLSTDGTTAPATETVPTHTTTETSYTFTGLTPETEYFVWVRDNCGTDGYSAWVGSESFTTQASCPTPVLNDDGITNITAHTADVEWSNFTENTSYEVSYRTAAYFDGVTEEFGTTPTGWARYTGLLSSVMNGTTLTSANSGWSFGSNNGVFDNHARVNIYDNYQRWLVTPALTVPENGALTFDMALTAYSGTLSAPQTTGTDDRFVVLITTDEMATWTVLREWNNSGSEYVYNNIACTATGENVMIDLGEYVDQTVRIAFYGESTINNADNNLHIDNVGVGVAVPAGEWQTQNVTENSLQLTDLAAETRYDVKVAGYCDATDGGESDTLHFTTTIACPVPTGLAIVGDATANSVTLTWTAGAVNQNAWVVEYATDVNFTDVQTRDANSHSDFVLNGLTPETHYWVRVKADCGNDGYSEVSNVIDFITPIACPAPTNLTLVNSTTSSLTVSWTENGDATSWTVCYKAEEDENDFHCDQNVTVNPYTIIDLGDGVNYNVKVTANCDNGYPSPEISAVFQTEASCPTPTDVAYSDVTPHGATITWEGEAANHVIEYRTVTTAEFNETYDFDDNSMQGWTTYDEDGDGYSWAVNNSSTDAHSGSYCVKARYNGNAVPYNWLISPEIPLGGTLRFYAKRYSSGSGENFQVYVSTTGTDIADFTAISDVTSGSSSYTMYEYDLSSYSGNGYVAIRHTAASNQWYLYIDDINITANVVSGYGEWQTVDNANSPHVLDILNPETNYEVRVKGVCGSTPSPASNIVGFTTLVACPVPEGFAVDNSTITHNSVELSWTVIGGTSYVVAYKADGETDFNEVENVTSVPYTLPGLNPETQYTVKVKSDCGSEGPSQWSEPKTFTTIEACAAPTVFTLGTVTAHEATFSWTAGNGNESWKVYVKKHTDAEYPETYTEVTTLPTTEAPFSTGTTLVANTAYDVKIVPDCDDTKYLEVENAFTTECEAQTISAEGWTENFDNYTGNSTNYYAPSGYPNHTKPTCWKFLNMSTNSSNYPQAFLSTNSGYPVSGNCLFFKSSSTTPIYAILPEFTNNTSDLAITFTYRNESTTSSNGTIIVGYMTNPYDDNTFEPVLTCDITNTLTTKTATFTDAPNGSYIAFKYQGSTSNYYASIDDVIVYIPTTIAKTIEANKWYAISSPVHNSNLGQTVDGVTNLSEGSLYGYTEATGTWNNTITVLETGKGYIYRRGNQADITFSGLANTNDKEVAVTASCPDIDLKGFNLLGNPFNHQINYSSFYQLNANGSWIANDNGTIGVAEGFLIHHDGSANSVTLMAGNSKSQSAPAASTTLTFTVSNGMYTDVAYAKLDDGDALPKIGHLEANAPALSIPVDGMKYAIATLGNDCESFDMTFSGKGEYTLSVDARNSGLSYVHLIDKVTGSDIDLLRQPSYHFSAGLSDLTSRFLVKLVPGDENVSDGDFAFWNGRGWTVEGEGTLQVFDALGRRILAKEVNSQLTIDRSQFPGTGVYILRLGEKTQKIVVR